GSGMWKVDFNPGMRISLADREIASKVVPFRREKACHQPSGNADAPKHEHHCGCIMLTIPGLSREEKIVDRMGGSGRVCIEAIAIVREQMLEYDRCFFIGRGRLNCELASQLRESTGFFWKLQVPVPDGIGVFQCRCNLFLVRDRAFT